MSPLDKVMHWRRQVIERATAGMPVTRVCREAGISRTLFYRWKQRYLRAGEAGLRPRPARPRRWGRQSPPALEQAVLAYALAYPTQGPRRIAEQLAQRRYKGWRVSATGAYKILRRHGLRTRWERLARVDGKALAATGLVTERAARRLARRVRPGEAGRPGDLVCLDSFYIGKVKGAGRVWQLTACDAAARYGIAQVIRGAPRAAQAAAFWTTRVLPAYRRAGHAVRAVLTDGGTEWRGAFAVACRRAGIAHRRTQPRPAWSSGAVERLQGTIVTECWRVVLRQPAPLRLEQLQRALQRYLRFYNEQRTLPGTRLQGRTPRSVFRGHAA
jgi:transposase